MYARLFKHAYTVTIGWYRTTEAATVHAPVCTTRIKLWAWLVYQWYAQVSIWGPVALYRDDTFLYGSGVK